jgi:hypothetical protein
VAITHQVRPLQDAKMLRDGRLRDAGSGRQSADRLLAFPAQPLEQRPSRRIRKGSEEHIVRVRHLMYNSMAID